MNSKISHDSETEAKGRQVFTAVAFIHHNFNGIEKVFMPRRAMTKKFLPGVYELPGGHVDFGEDMVEGLKREVFEEFGMEIKVGDPIGVFTYTNEIKGSHSIEVVYFATFTGDFTDITLHPEDHESYDWFAEDELHKVASANADIDDIELGIVRKAFRVLRGEKLDIAT